MPGVIPIMYFYSLINDNDSHYLFLEHCQLIMRIILNKFKVY